VIFRLSMPEAVMKKFDLMQSDTDRCRPATRERLLARSNQNNSISPQWPSTTWRSGCRSKVPRSISRSAAVAASRCHPQPKVARARSVMGSNPR
jgi:hypothetical protein